MARGKSETQRSEAIPTGARAGVTDTCENKEPRTLKLAAAGVTKASDFAKLMSGLMSDLIEGRVTPQIGNAVCNAGGKLLKVVEMSHKYGNTSPGTNRRELTLVFEEKQLAAECSPAAALERAAGE